MCTADATVLLQNASISVNEDVEAGDRRLCVVIDIADGGVLECELRVIVEAVAENSARMTP